MQPLAPPARGSQTCAHAGATERGTCARCGLFVCEACRAWFGGKSTCRGCREILARTRPSKRAVLALLLSTLGMVTLVTGMFGLVLARRELRAIRAGDAPLSGESLALAARNLGWFDLLLLGIVLVGMAFRH